MKDFIMQDLLSEEIINFEMSVYTDMIGDILMNTEKRKGVVEFFDGSFCLKSNDFFGFEF